MDEINNENDFNLNKYFELLDKIIQNILLRKEKDVLTYDILDDDNVKKIRIQCLKLKQFKY